MQEYLFYEIDGFAFFGEREDELREEINSLTKEDLKNSDDSIKIFLTTKHMIKTIEFEDYYQVDKGEIQFCKKCGYGLPENGECSKCR